MPVDEFPIKTETVDAVLEYLNLRPYGEVKDLIASIHGDYKAFEARATLEFAKAIKDVDQEVKLPPIEKVTRSYTKRRK